MTNSVLFTPCFNNQVIDKNNKKQNNWELKPIVNLVWFAFKSGGIINPGLDISE